MITTVFRSLPILGLWVPDSKNRDLGGILLHFFFASELGCRQGAVPERSYLPAFGLGVLTQIYLLGVLA